MLFKISVNKLSGHFGLSLTNPNIFTWLLSILILFFLCINQIEAKSPNSEKWVGTWATAPQLVEERNMPPKPGLSNNTIRQVVHVSIGGNTLQMRFSNEFSKSPVVMKAVHIAQWVDSCIIDPETDLALKFSGEDGVTIKPGAAVFSDPFQFALKPLSNLTITIYFGDTSPDVTGHPGSRTTSYILPGNEVSSRDFAGAAKTDHWYIINSVNVKASDSAAAVVVLGNSITDGRGSGTNKQNRWPDELARRFHANTDTRKVAVLNQGIGGNCILRDCLGPSALSRFDRDILKQKGVRWLIILEGINDIGGSKDPEKVANGLIDAYKQMINSAHAEGIKVYGATILPFGDSFYDSEDHQLAWKTVNEWIRNSGKFDAVIDLDAELRDPDNPLHLLPAADSGDHLHPSEKGHHLMAEAVDLDLFK
jgi:lysophospholipase L1-like esterase